MTFVLPNNVVPNTLADANAVEANFNYIIAGMNTLNNEIVTNNIPYFVSTATTTATGIANVAAIQADLQKVAAAGGGYYLLPFGTIPVSGSIYVGAPSGSAGTFNPTIIQGTGNGTILLQQANTDTFLVNNNPGSNGDIKGLDFRNFEIKYVAALTSGVGIHGIGINGGSENVRIDSMVFYNCPNAIAMDAALQWSILRCTFQYDNNQAPAATGIVTFGIAGSAGHQAIECWIFACIFRVKNSTGGGAGGLCLGIYNAENLRLEQLRIEGMTQGVLVQPGPNNAGTNICQKLRFISVYIESADTVAGGNGQGWLFMPATSGSIIGVSMVDCWCNTGQANTKTSNPGIQFDTTNAGATIDGVQLIGCKANAYGGAGLQFNAGSTGTLQNVTIDGGYYYQNGAVTTTGVGSAGIYFHGSGSGTMQKIVLQGVTCSNTATIIPGPAAAGTQAYGFTADGTVNELSANGCNFNGNGTNATLFSLTTPTNFFLYNCKGYNDQATVVALLATIPTSGTQFDGSTVGATPYYGAILANWSGGTVSGVVYGHNRVAIGTTTVSISTPETLYLAQGTSVAINYSVTPTAFCCIGM